MQNNSYLKYINNYDLDNGLDSLESAKEGLLEIHLRYPNATQKSSGVSLLYDKESIYVDNLDNNTLLIGATGSKKTRCVIIPTIINLAEAGENIVIGDPKGEIFNKVSGYLKKKGYIVNSLNFREPEKSDCFNPLTYPSLLVKDKKPDEALEEIYGIAETIKDSGLKGATPNDPYWADSACSLIKAALIANVFDPTCYLSIEFVNSVIDEIGKMNDDSESGDPLTGIEAIYHSLPSSNPLKSKLRPVIENSPTTRKCILSVASGFLEPFTINRKISNLMSKSTIKFEDYTDPNKKVVTFLIFPDEKETYNAIGTLFVRQLYNYLISVADKKFKGPLPIRANFILDEFANLPVISCFSNMISAGRSRNIRFLLSIQNNAQLNSKYEKVGSIIKYNCQNWIFLNSKELDILKEICEEIGPDKDGKNFLTVSQLRKLKKTREYTEAIILCSNRKAFASRLPDCDFYVNEFKKDWFSYPPVAKTTSIVPHKNTFWRGFQNREKKWIKDIIDSILKNLDSNDEVYLENIVVSKN